MLQKFKITIKENRYLIILLIMASLLILVNLGDTYLYIDEANTGALAKNILKFGYPKVYDGKNFFSPFSAQSISKDMAWLEQPWLQYYIVALSLKIFGINSFAARLPLAVCGIASVYTTYLLALRLNNNSKKIALFSAAVMVLSVPFLVFSRYCRYYTLAFLLGPLMMVFYLDWVNSCNLKNLCYYILTSILLFYSFYPIFVCLSFSALFFTNLYNKKNIKKLIVAEIIIMIFVLPWIIYGGIGSPAGTEINPIFMLQKGILVYIWKIQAYHFPYITLLLILLIAKVLEKKKIIHKKISYNFNSNYVIYVGTALYIIVVAFVPMISSQYLVGILPFIYILMAMLLLKIRQYGIAAFAITFTLCFATNLLHVAPYILIEKAGLGKSNIELVVKNPQSMVVYGNQNPLSSYLEEFLNIRFYMFDHLYQLTHHYSTRSEGIVEYLKDNATDNDTVLSWWGEVNTLMFYTDMRVIYHPYPLLEDKDMVDAILQPVDKIDWVLPDGIFLPEQLSQLELLDKYKGINDDVFYHYDLEDYEKIEIDCPKMFLDPDPNIELHNFRTPQAPSFYIYKLKDIN